MKLTLPVLEVEKIQSLPVEGVTCPLEGKLPDSNVGFMFTPKFVSPIVYGVLLPFFADSSTGFEEFSLLIFKIPLRKNFWILFGLPFSVAEVSSAT